MRGPSLHGAHPRRRDALTTGSLLLELTLVVVFMNCLLHVATVDWYMSSKLKDKLRGHKEVFEWLKKMLKEMVATGTFVVKINEEDGKERAFEFHILS